MGDISLPREYILCLLPGPAPTDIIDAIEQRHPNVEIVWKQGRAEDISDEEWAKTTILFTLQGFPGDPSLVPNLKLVHFASAGTNHVVHTPIYTDTDIPLTASSGVHGPQIAEWVVMQLLSLSHKQKLMLKWQKEHKWGSHAEAEPIRDSVTQRFGVLGYGSIGRQAGRVCKAMGMDVIAFTASPRKTPESKKDRGYIVPGTGDPDGTFPSAWYSGLDKPSLHKFLKQDLDVLLVSVPLTDVTRHFLGKEEFEILGKKNALVINIARGAIIVHDDLVAALKKDQKDGGLRGAALDVTEPEPLNEDSELWDLENVSITPHISNLGTNYIGRSFEILERNLINLEHGRKLINEVDRKKGY